MEITVNIVDTLFDSIPKGTVVANYVTEVDTVNFKMYSTVYSIDETNKAIVTTKKVDANNLEAIHFDAINWVTTDKATIDNIYPKVVSKYLNKFKKEGVIYKITKDYDLNNCILTIPDNCTLLFEGGTITNGSVIGNINNDYVRPEWFGAKCDGISNDTKAIQMSINLKPKKIVFPSGRVIFTSNLSITNAIRLEGNGSTLLFDSDCYVTVNYHKNVNSNVTNIAWTSSTPRISKVYIPNPSLYKRGDIVKIYSDDLIEGTNFRQSLYFIVGDIQNSYIEVAGKAVFNFTTNIKMLLIDNSKKIEIDSLTLSSLEHTYYNDRGLFTIIGGAYHNITNCCIKNTNSHGFLFAGSYGYTVDNLELDFLDFINTVPQSIGMGVADSASSNFSVSFKGGYTQAFTCVYFTEDKYPETYGVSLFGSIRNSIAFGSALDNHTNCYNLVYSDSIISSSENGIVVRGNKCIYDNISVNAAIYGLYAYGDAHNTGNSIDFLVRNTNIYSHTRCVQIENNKEYKIKGTIENCILEGRTAAVHLKNADIVFRNCTITGLITISNNVNVIFDNCTLNGYINIAEGITDSNVIISNSICNFTNHSYFRECPATIENCTINIKGQYYILVTLATNLVFNKVTFNTPYQYLLRTLNSARVELNSCIVNHTGTNAEFHVFRTIGITIDVILLAIFNDVYIYNKSSQDTKVYLSYVDSWKGGSSINNIVRAVYIDNNKLTELNICNRTDRIMVINDILDNPEYAERGKINTDGTLKSKLVIVYRVEDIVPGLTDTIYKIVKDIDLDGKEKGIPANCTLDFLGGSFSNGTLIGSNTKIKAGLNKIFDTNITLSGTWDVNEAYPEWFGYKTSNAIQLCLDYFPVTKLTNSTYICDTAININTSRKILTGEGNNTILDFSTCDSNICVNISAYRSVLQNLVILTNTIKENQTGISFIYSTENGRIENVILQGFYNGMIVNKTWYSVINNVRIRDISSNGFGLLVGNISGTTTEEVNSVSFNKIWIEGGKNSVKFNHVALGSVIFDSCTFERNQETALISEAQVKGAVSFKNCYFEKNYLSETRTTESVILWYKGVNDVQAYFEGGLYRDLSGITSYMVDNASFLSPMYISNSVSFATDKIIDYTPNGINASKFNRRRYYNENFLLADFNSLDEQTISLRPIYSSFDVSVGSKKKFVTIVLAQDIYYSAYIRVDLIVRVKRPTSELQGVISYNVYIDKYSSSTSDQGMTIVQADNILQKKFSSSTLDLRKSISLKGKVLPYNSTYDTSPFILYIDAIEGTSDYIIDAKIYGYRTAIGTNPNNYLIKENTLVTNEEMNATSAVIYNKIGSTEDRPSGAKIEEGFQYFDTSLSKYICWNGTTWTNLDGSTLT